MWIKKKKKKRGVLKQQLKNSYEIDLSLYHERERKTGCNSISKNPNSLLGEISYQKHSTFQTDADGAQGG